MFRYCNKWWHYPVVVLPAIGFIVMMPVWYLCSLYWWKDNTDFMMNNIELVTLQPWNIRENFKQ